MSSFRFPPGFLWGTATAAHQVEGGNVNSDCWALEHAVPSLFAEPSGDAVDHYHRYTEDIGIVAALGLDAYRFSIEWARIEPERGHFSMAALDHYRRCIESCRERGIAPLVTFHHFTLPGWMARLGGFGAPDFPALFGRYCERAARALEGLAAACTINELNLPVFAGPYLHARASAGQRDAAERALGAPLSAFFLFAEEDAILNNGLVAHAAARAAIRAVRADVPVGMTLAISEETAEPGAERMREARRERYYSPFLDAAAADDFVGIQTYSRTMARVDGHVGPAPDRPLSSMGWEDRPEALGEVCRWVASRWRTPMIVTENGYPGADDERRAAFIRSAIDGLASAIADGADVRGYFYWSLLDNFEWLFGFSQRFGLVAVDRIGQTRSIKRSAETLRSIATASRRADT